MKKSQAILGILLVLIGALLILQGMNYLQGTWENVLWTVVSGTAGTYLLYLFFSSRKRWWWLIGGSLLIGVMIEHLLFLLYPQIGAMLGDTILLCILGLSFIGVFLSNRTNWWAMVPGGVLVTIGLIELTENTDYLLIDSNILLFLGLGFTFLLLYLIPTPVGRLHWAIYPSIPLLLVGAFLAYSSEDVLWQLAGPIVIILAGMYFIFNTFRQNTSQPKPIKTVLEPQDFIDSTHFDDEELSD